jgi:hypothetical protein
MWNPFKDIEKRLDKIEHILDGGLLFTGLVEKVRKLESRVEMRDYGPKSLLRPTSDWDVASTPKKPQEEYAFEPSDEMLQEGRQTLSLLSVEVMHSRSSGKPILKLKMEDDQGRPGWVHFGTDRHINTLMTLHDLLQEKIDTGNVGFPCKVKYVKYPSWTRKHDPDELWSAQIQILRFSSAAHKEPII